ncbi:MAG TPA: type III secretion system export apparatus subunit SctV [Rhodocyclaceae bacterium]|nr:type III secretion system export apparatus subunit SctV [Rhodocyclaceae bacterium]
MLTAARRLLPGSSSFSADGVIRRISAQQDLLLVVLIVAVIALMVLPLPPFLLDTLIAINLTISMVLLMVALYVRGALELSTFPAILLLTTLFRLSLNIASTRQILLNAYAGEIILTFGKMVVGGSVIVGAVVFVIIAVVQFIVIAKGAERVSEVAARFSLDAMPGKQMSIDADLRAGVVDKDEARRRRSILERESHLYGAMDGAMKFVKGDAIAALIIAAINIVAGIGVGMVNHGMSASHALETYSVLTVGDALVSQIPSLLISIAAGIVITRVSNSERTDGNVGREIFSQIQAQPKAMVIGGTVMFAMLLVPGFPKLQFIALGCAVAFVGWRLLPAQILRQGGNGARPMPSFRRDGGVGTPSFLEDTPSSIATPLVISLHAGIKDDLDTEELDNEMMLARRELSVRLGLPFPGLSLRVDDRLPEQAYVVLVSEVPVLQGEVLGGSLYAFASPKRLEEVGCEVVMISTSGAGACWVDPRFAEVLDEHEIAWLSAEKLLTQQVFRVIAHHAADFLGVQEVLHLLRALGDRYPDLDKELRQAVPIPRLVDVLRRLVQEQVSLYDMRSIAQVLVEWAGREKDNATLVEYIRNALSRQITFSYMSQSGTLPAFVMAPALEEQLKKYLMQSGVGNVLVPPEALRQGIARQLASAASQDHGAGPTILLVSGPDLRPHVRALLIPDVPDLVVLAVPQLEQSVRVQGRGQIQIHA